MLVEIATFSVEAALTAQEAGADRIELCSAPMEGGLTASLGTLRTVKKLLSIPVYGMIRPREGDFLYSRSEFDSMLQDIEIFRDEGMDGIVTGILNSDGTVDVSRMKIIASRAGKMDITFHRAFDMARDQLEALNSLIDCGIKRILTSGSKKNALDGSDKIRELVLKAGNRLSVMPGGGITEKNALEIIHKTGVHEIHLTAKKITESKMLFRNTGISMGSNIIPNEYELTIPDSDLIRQLIRLLD